MRGGCLGRPTRTRMKGTRAFGRECQQLVGIGEGPTPVFRGEKLEARAGIEPAHRAFAELGLTTWLPRPRSHRGGPATERPAPSQSTIGFQAECCVVRRPSPKRRSRHESFTRQVGSPSLRRRPHTARHPPTRHAPRAARRSDCSPGFVAERFARSKGRRSGRPKAPGSPHLAYPFQAMAATRGRPSPDLGCNPIFGRMFARKKRPRER